MRRAITEGNFGGLGKEREIEFVQSCHVLGIPSCRVKIASNPLLQDGMKNNWSAEAIEREIEHCSFSFDLVNQSCSLKILTFDSRGISGHPNHIDCLSGVKKVFIS